MFFLLCTAIVILFAVLIVCNSPYLGWDYTDPETAMAGTAFHAFEWVFVRSAPVLFLGAAVGVYLTRKKA